jgi:RHS repeat-associated protein
VSAIVFPGTGRVYRESKGGTVVKTSYYYTGNTFYSGLVSQIDTPTPAGTGSAYRAYDSVGTLIFEWGNGTQPVKYTYDTFLRMASMTSYHTSSLSDFGAATWPSSGGQITTWNYGTVGELALQREKVYPDSQKTRYTYHPSGNLATRLWSRGGGITTTYGYDGYGRRASIDYPSHPSSPDNGASYDVTYAYNPAGQISERYDAAGKTTITYRPDGRVDDETTATSSGTQNLLVGAQVSRTFDALGQLEKLDSQVTSSAVSPTIKYAYENVNFGRLGEIEVSTIGSTTTYDRRLRYFYGTDTRYWTTLYGDVKSGGSYANTSRGERNFSSERLSYAYWYGVNGGSSALIQRFNLDYTGDLVTGVRREDGKWLYGYDTAGQVTAARKEFVNGSGVPTGESYGGTKAGYAYDLMGNRTSSSEYGGGVSDAATPVTRIYTPNVLNQYSPITNDQTVSVTGFRPNSSTAVTINTVAPTYQTELQYSGAGGWFLTGWERYVYDGWNQILTVHMEDNGTTVRGRVSTNVWGPDLASLPYDRQTWQAAGGVAGLVLIRDGVSTFTGHAGWSAPTDPTDDDYFLFHDHLGNVTGYRKAVVGVAVGAMAAIYEYDAFGRELRASYDAVGSPNVKNMPYRFSTKFTDVESGCVYYGYRIYDPTKGRWLNRDPILERGHFALHQLKKTVPAKARMLAGHNNYSFIFNRPISAVDPDGRFPLILVPIVAGGGAGAICAWGCQGRVNSALSAAEKEADANAPDGTTHRNPRVDIGGDADALTHCIAGCKLAKFWWPCHGPDDALAELQKRENKPGDDSTMDRNNNAAGVGLGNGIGTGQLGYPGQTCLEGCLGLLRGGDLSELNYTEPPSEVIPSS